MEQADRRECLIEIDGLQKRHGQKLVLGGLQLTVQAGEVFGLLGPNGAGKTTTMSILATLQGFDQGQVHLCGHDLANQAEKIRPLVGFVPQELALYETLSAQDNLAFFGRIYGLWGSRLRKRVDRVLDLVGLANKRVGPVSRFSGGMKRRLNIAVALIHEPQVLFLDEPTVGVDPQSRNMIFEHIEQMKSQGITIVYSTHYMEEAMRLCDRIAIMDAGLILVLDTPEALVGLLGEGLVSLRVDNAAVLVTEIEALDGVARVGWFDEQLVIESNNPQHAMAQVLDLCRLKRVSIRTVELLEPNLENVFLHLTGRRLRD